MTGGTSERPFRVVQVIANLEVDDLDAAVPFYRDELGLSEQEFDLGWVTRCTAPASGAMVQLVTRDAVAPANPAISVKVDDVEAAYQALSGRGHEIVHPLTTEAWGVRRFLVRAPDGTVVNVVHHVE